MDVKLTDIPRLEVPLDGPLKTSTVQPTLNLRWKGDALEQQWLITEYLGSRPTGQTAEWRPIPKVAGATP